MTTSATTITLLAPRLRVEERQLNAAFSARGYETEIVDPARLGISLRQPSPEFGSVVIDRRVATVEGAALGALLAASGTLVVNRTATTRLLADRLALLRHLIIAGIPTPTAVAAFGEQAALAALDTVGYPARLLSLTFDPRIPDAVVDERDAAEAVVEHRATLGHERAVLVQRHVEGEVMRLTIVGSELVGVERVCDQANSECSVIEDERRPGHLQPLADTIIARLGTGVYTIDVVDASDGLVVVGAGNIVDFRSLAASEIDVAGRIADYTIQQLNTWEDARA